MSISKNIRLQGKQSLNNNWTSAITVVFVFLLSVFSVFAFSSLLYYIISYFKINTILASFVLIVLCALDLILISPIFSGIINFFYKLSETEKTDVAEVFSFFKKKLYFKTVLFNIYNSRFFIIIGIASLCTLILAVENKKIELALITIILFICLLLSGILTFTEQLLYVDNPYENFSYYKKAKKVINAKHAKDHYKLFFSFIFWFALCYFVLPIFYVMPYVLSSFATSGKWLIKLYKDGIIV